MACDYSFFGRGRFFVGLRDGSGPMLPLGNSSVARFGIDENEISQPDYENAGGGECNTLSRINRVNLEFNMFNLTPQNLSRVLRAAHTTDTAEAVAAEAHAAVKQGGLVATDRIIDLTDPATVIVTDVGAATTFVLDTDYTLTAAGPVITAGGGIADNTDIEITYNAVQEDILEALVSSAEEYRGVFVGLNEARSNKKVVVHVHRIKFTPTQQFDLITEADDFSALAASARVLSDPDITATGLSKYFSVRLEI